MEGLRSAEALQVHWDAAHSETNKKTKEIEEEKKLGATLDGASASTPPIKRCLLFLYWLLLFVVGCCCCSYIVCCCLLLCCPNSYCSYRDQLPKRPQTGSQYIPELPDEGSVGELDTYRTMAQEMIVLINVRCKGAGLQYIMMMLLVAGGKICYWYFEITNQPFGGHCT